MLIVEDEPYTRDGIIASIDWNQIGIHKIYTAEDGLQGLEMARLYSPNIVLTDMRMPRVNGADMAESIKNMLPGCMFIFMSGYSDRCYYKSALHVSAMDYINKPIDIDELKNALLNAINHVIENQNKEESISTLRRNELAAYLIRENGDADKLMFLWMQNGMPGGEGFELYTLLYGGIASAATLKHIYNTAGRLSIRVVARRLKDFYVVHAVIPCGTGLIMKYSESLIQTSDDNEVYIVIGKPVFHPTNLIDSYNDSLNTHNQRFYHPDKQIFMYGKASTSLDMGYDPAKELSGLLLKQPEQVKRWTLEQFEYMRKHDATPVDLIKFNGFRISTLLYFLANHINEDNIINGPVDEAVFWRKISAFDNIYKLRDFVLEGIEKLENSRILSSANLPIFMEIQKFINIHYSEPITLDIISGHVNMSVTYLCKIFKDMTGQTINDYIMDCRIQKAKLLLQNTNMHIHEIAEATGYSSSSYFIKAFRKSSGITPEEYRKGHGLL